MSDNVMTTVDEYIASYPPEQQAVMEKVRAIILASTPGVIERIAWQMPSYKLKRPLIHFAATKKHLGIYPGTVLPEIWGDMLKEYDTSKGTIRFPWNKPIPYDLIEQIVAARVLMLQGDVE
ncbi:MAG: DUF1801 domain-containing protein [Propionibacteriaceae bacterium]|jgi:uncharacterized protein YdhG (YjbR/CyaY superfamily)|nr:DUF1801 domain-containing protein [Propionibacteriaceae bacterium]